MVYKAPATDLLPTNFTEGCNPFNKSSADYNLIDLNRIERDSYSSAVVTETPLVVSGAALGNSTDDDGIDWTKFPYVFYSISYLWIAPFNFLFTFIVTSVISIATGGNEIRDDAR